MMMRLMPPIWTILSPGTTSSRFCPEPNRVRMRPIIRVNTDARVTRAFLPPPYAVEGSRSTRLLLGKATAAARTAMRAGNRKARKLPSIAIVSL
jgi:hypothetical protein